MKKQIFNFLLRHQITYISFLNEYTHDIEIKKKRKYFDKEALNYYQENLLTNEQDILRLYWFEIFIYLKRVFNYKHKENIDKNAYLHEVQHSKMTSSYIKYITNNEICTSKQMENIFNYTQQVYPQMLPELLKTFNKWAPLATMATSEDKETLQLMIKLFNINQKFTNQDNLTFKNIFKNRMLTPRFNDNSYDFLYDFIYQNFDKLSIEASTYFAAKSTNNKLDNIRTLFDQKIINSQIPHPNNKTNNHKI